MFNCLNNSIYSNLYQGMPMGIGMPGMMGMGALGGRKDPNGGSLIYGPNINKTVGLNTAPDNYCETINENNAKKKSTWKKIGIAAATVAGILIFKKPILSLLGKGKNLLKGIAGKITAKTAAKTAASVP